MSTYSIKRIDKALGQYYHSVGKIHYFSNAVGLFANYCKANALDDSDIRFELQLDATDSILVDFDEQFPLKSSITDATERAKEIFRIIKRCNQKPPLPTSTDNVTVVVKSDHGRHGTKVKFYIRKLTKLKKLMDAFCARVGVEPGSVRFFFAGDRISPESTASELGIGDNAVIDAHHEKHGGGPGPCLAGPDLESVLCVEDWSDVVSADRQLTWGLNIEFVLNEERLIGQVQQRLDETITIDVARDYKKAYCPSKGVHCPSVRSIVNYWFCGCKVDFKGETADGEEVDEVQVFGRKPCYYSGANKQYAWLEMTVSIADEQEHSDDDDEYIPYFEPPRKKQKRRKQKCKSVSLEF